jgi:amino acid transporter
LRRTLIGRPLESAEAIHERLTKTKALAIFSSDAVSSTAYATEEILLVLVLAGAVAYNYLLPIGFAIVALLAIVAFSYRQTIHAYPQGGGSYIVTKDNLGTLPSLIAASALLTDYILTVAVSISSGIAQITSAVESLHPFRVELAVGAITVIALLNLRGIRESGSIFALPTYLFIGGMAVLIAMGAAAWAGLGVTTHPVSHEIPQATHALTIFLVLRAFASGCAALTGVEAISDGVAAFKPPEAVNAAKTLVAMAIILGVIFSGITLLSRHFHLVPSESETLISQLSHTILGTSPFYYFIQGTTAGILLLAANTSFADFPRLSYFLARDRFVPRQFAFRGDRLAFSTGIITLAIAASLLVIVFQASVTRLIPLYAVGVFVAFTLSQASMTYRWWRSPKGHRRTTGLLINGTGATTTGVVAAIIVVTKFLGGAWFVILLIPFLILNLKAIHRHYAAVSRQLKLDADEARAQLSQAMRTPAVFVPLDSINQATVRALRYAEQVSGDVTAVHVAEGRDEAETLQRRWDEIGLQIPLIIIESPYRQLIGPLVRFIEAESEQRSGNPITVVLPEFVPAHWYDIFLHTLTAWRLRLAFWRHRGIIVISVPYHLQA